MENKHLTERIRRIHEYIPNKSTYAVRLDANESPFLPSAAVMREFHAALENLPFNRYPDPIAEGLISKFASLYKVNPDCVVFGNGSDELISLIVSGFTDSGDVVTTVDPDFSMYQFYAEYAGAVADAATKNADFIFSVDELIQRTNEKKTKLLLFSNPCNPTGQLLRQSEVRRLVEHTSALVVLDEAYMEFADSDESMLSEVEKYDNLIILKTLSKAFGSASMRLGAAVSNRELTAAIRKIKSPYNVNTVSQTFGSIVLDHADEIRGNLAVIRENTAHLYNALTEIQTAEFVKVMPTETNFVFVKMTSGEHAIALSSYLKENGIAIRCFAGLSGIRITAGTREETDTVLAAVRRYYA